MMNRTLFRSFVCAHVVCSGALVAACASTQETVVRELPPGLAPLSELLQGCATAIEDDGATVATCEDNVVFRVRNVTVVANAPPQYFGDGVDFANINAGRMDWTLGQLETTLDKGIIDRGEVHAVADDSVVAVLLGAARDPDGGMQIEASCEARVAAEQRCVALLTAFLDRPRARAAAVPVAAAGERGGHIAGRFFALPEGCRVITETNSSGRYGCDDDDASLTWLLADNMDAASLQAEGVLSTLAAGDREPVPCAVFDGDVRCEGTGAGVVGLGYLAGKPFAVACVAASPLAHPLCKSVVRRK
jgi:hypothetical protein